MLAASNTLTNDPAMDAEIETVRHALDRSLDEKWDHFRTDFRELWGQFQTECIESSHKLVVAEKAAADERFAALKDAYDKVKAKCADFDRYNQLLQEKLDQTQAEMKSLSAVSMTIQWEKRVASKQAECERLTKQLETQKQVNTTLKRENTLLNTQLEQWGEAREAELAEAEAREATEAAVIEVSAVSCDTHETAASSEAAVATHEPKAEAVAVSVTVTATTTAATEPEPVATDEPPAAASLADVGAPESSGAAPKADAEVVSAPPATETSTVAPESEQTHAAPAAVVVAPEATATAAPEDTASVPATTPAAAPVPVPVPVPVPAAVPATEPAETAAPEPAPSVTPAEPEPPAPPAITYTLKKLKRKKADTEKTPFLLGSDDVLYAWTEGDVPGAAVGTKTARGYKFTKK